MIVKYLHLCLTPLPEGLLYVGYWIWTLSWAPWARGREMPGSSPASSVCSFEWILAAAPEETCRVHCGNRREAQSQLVAPTWVIFNCCHLRDLTCSWALRETGLPEIHLLFLGQPTPRGISTALGQRDHSEMRKTVKGKGNNMGCECVLFEPTKWKEGKKR